MLASATDHQQVLALNRELREIVDEREVLELEWLEAADLLGQPVAGSGGRVAASVSRGGVEGGGSGCPGRCQAFAPPGRAPVRGSTATSRRRPQPARRHSRARVWRAAPGAPASAGRRRTASSPRAR